MKPMFACQMLQVDGMCWSENEKQKRGGQTVQFNLEHTQGVLTKHNNKFQVNERQEAFNIMSDSQKVQRRSKTALAYIMNNKQSREKKTKVKPKIESKFD